MRSTIRIVAAGLALTAGSLGSLVAASPAGAAPAASAGTAASVPTAARDGAGWLGRQFKTDGDLPASEGEAGITYLPLAIVALASAEVGSKQIASGIRYLKANFRSYVSVPETKTKSVDDPGRLGELILAAVASKANPKAFGGTKAANNLVARLLATQAKTGANKGLFGSPNSPTYSSAYTQGLVLLALAAVGERNALGASWLAAQQCSDGGWTSYRSSTKTACPKINPSEYTGPDTNDTALAVEGLVASKVSSKHSPLTYFKDSQYAGGTFGYYGSDSKSQAPDPDSTALVAQALIALGKLKAVEKKGKTAVAGLAIFQLACGAAAAQRGAYWYPGSKSPNLLATEQAIPAAAGVAYPVKAGSPSSALPKTACG